MKLTLGNNLITQGIVRSLNRTSRDLSTVQERIASGQRINSAKDDAAGLSIATKLEADTRIYTQGVRNVSDGLSYLAIADQAANELTGVLTRMSELATQSANGIYSTKQRAALDAEFQALRSEYNRIIQSSSFNGRRVFNDRRSTSSRDVTIQAGFSTLRATTESEALGTAGTGAYAAATTLTTTSSAAHSTTSADVDGDGDMDIISSDYGASGISVFKNNGDGTFAARTSFGDGGTAPFPVSVRTGDIDGDGDLDVIAAALTHAQVYFNNGSGDYGSAVDYAGAASTLRDAYLADVNNDGSLDMIYNDETTAAFYTRLNNGSGTFGAATTFAASGADIGFTVSDLNNDGNVDLIGYEDNSATISIRLGNGNNTFGSVLSNTTSGVANSFGVRFGDINGDSIEDMIVAGNGGVSVSIGNGNGTFGSGTVLTTTQARSVELGDLDGDDLLDIVFAGDTSNLTGVYLNNDSGAFTAGPTFSGGVEFGNALSLADFNGDGVLDLAKGSKDYAANITVQMQTTTQRLFYSGVNLLASMNITSQSNARSVMSSLQTTLSSVAQARSQMASSQQRLTVAMNNLSRGAEEFTSARSRIVDADMATEVASLLRLKIQQQASVAALAQSKQQSQIVLRLLKF